MLMFIPNGLVIEWILMVVLHLLPFISACAIECLSRRKKNARQ